MSKASTIEWTRSTFNPWWGCEKVSPACAHCYAERAAKRYGKALWGGDNSQRELRSDRYWQEPLKWNKQAQREGQPWRVFTGSMCDILEDREDLLVSRVRLWELIEHTPYLTWLLLTKRPERFRTATPQRWWQPGQWPRNAWAGTTVENQEWADHRIPHLLQVPAPVRFLSCEPLLGELDLSGWLWKSGCEPHCGARCSKDMDCPFDPSHQLHWVIAGGESGPQARPTHPRWLNTLAHQCVTAEVSFFFKQHGEWREPIAGERFNTMDGRAGHPPAFLVDREGNLHCTREAAGPSAVPMVKVGKEKAGRLLDGREWNEIPEGVR